MENNYDKLKRMCLKNSISEGKTKDEFLFNLNAVDYFYYNRNIGEQDILDCFVDGPKDGGIDYIFENDDIMYLIQGKSSDSITIEEIKNVFWKINETVINFERKKYDDYDRRMRSIYLNTYDNLSDDKNIELILFTNATVNERLKEKIKEFKDDREMQNYKISVYDKNDIELKEVMSFQNENFIEEDYLEVYDNKNVLEYKDKGMIINIRASSLKKLYVKYSEKGLFSFNLREHISQKSVDSGIENTIKKEPENFWFYNNGITIGCNDYRFDGYKLKLYDFSIINGAQTTTKIGKSKIIDSDNDLELVCKLVKAKDSLLSEEGFIGKISEASNSQKPIKPRDLKANALEQKRLQVKMTNNEHKLAIEIKRGVKPLNYKKVEKWQRVTNEYIAQLILSCIFQKPGIARSGKSSIFTSDKVYNSIFLRNHDYNTIFELVKIGNYYEEFRLKYNSEVDDVDLLAISKNGKFTILAILFYFYKRYSNLIDKSSSSQLHSDNVCGDLTLNYHQDDIEAKFRHLFQYIIKELNNIYEKKKDQLKLTSYSNFFKTDAVYEDVILYEFDKALTDEWDKERIETFIDVLTSKPIN